MGLARFCPWHTGLPLITLNTARYQRKVMEKCQRDYKGNHLTYPICSPPFSTIFKTFQLLMEG